MSSGELERRLSERAAADKRYNDALTAVDRALPVAAAPAPPPAPLEQSSRSLAAGVVVPHTAIGGWRGRLARFVWHVVAPALQQQQAFNVALAEALERGRAEAQASARAEREALESLRARLEAFVVFDSRLVEYLQQITPFVDTKIRLLEQSLDELRMASGAAHRMAAAVRRELDGLASGAAGDESQRGEPAPAVAPGSTRGAGYVGFEDLFRGSSDEIRARQRDYADRFAGASDVLDIGCGRGEFLDLLRERGIRARGVEANPEMAAVCRDRGLDVRHEDALAYLRGLPDESLGGLFSAQVVEHLEPDYLVGLVEAAHAKLRPGASIVLETINAACWVAFFESYIRDITHVRPLHPDTLKFLVVAAGFEQVDVHFRSPVAEHGRLQPVATEGLSGSLAEVVQAFNGNVERLNERLFTYLEYAVIGAKGP